MKTDGFADIIRRKLESIRPEFTDKDWARMQSTLKDANLSQPDAPSSHQPFSGGTWSGQSWLLAAATVSTVFLLAFSVWQRREINQLRQRVGQLHPQPIHQPAPAPSETAATERGRLDVAQSNGATPSKQLREPITPMLRNESQAVRPDTVYITRSVAEAERTKTLAPRGERLSQRLATPTEQQQAPENPAPSSVSARPSTNLSHNQQTESYDASSTPSSIAPTNAPESTIANKTTGKSTKAKGSTSLVTRGQRTTRRVPLQPSSVSEKNGVPVGNETAQARPPVIPNEITATYERVTSRPLSLSNKNWTVSLAQRARRMKPTLSAPVVERVEQTQAPGSQPVERLTTRFRAGVGGEVASRLWSVGVFTEVLIGRRWLLGIGLSQATFLNRFVTEDDFNGRTQRDFRKEFGRGIDPWRDILNIDTRQVRLQLPLTLGYRIPLSQSLSLLPTVGTYLNLTDAENVTFYCRQPQRPPMQPQLQRGLEEIETSRTQPVAVVSNLALGAGLEWQRSHWVVQAAPVLTIPLKPEQQVKQPDLNWQQNTTIGLRARLLYQF